MKYTVKIADIKDKPVIHAMLQNYLRDLTEFETISQNESGEYKYPYLKYYRTENTRYPYLLYCNADISGFALVRKEEIFFSMAEFSVLPAFRRKGLGTLFALDIIQKHSGKWHIEYNVKNTAGMQFWNTLILNLVGAHYKRGPGEEENREYLEFIVGGK